LILRRAEFDSTNDEIRRKDSRRMLWNSIEGILWEGWRRRWETPISGNVFYSQLLITFVNERFVANFVVNNVARMA